MLIPFDLEQPHLARVRGIFLGVSRAPIPRGGAGPSPSIPKLLDLYIRVHSVRNGNQILHSDKLDERKIFIWLTMPLALAKIFVTRMLTHDLLLGAYLLVRIFIRVNYSAKYESDVSTEVNICYSLSLKHDIVNCNTYVALFLSV